MALVQFPPRVTCLVLVSVSLLALTQTESVSALTIDTVATFQNNPVLLRHTLSFKEAEEGNKDEQLKNDVVDVDPANKLKDQQGGDKDGAVGLDVSKTAVAVNREFTHGFIASLSVIIVSELGDKTFFIAAIMAMKHSRLTVLMGALGALFFMTVLSAMVGYATTVIPRALTYYISSGLFAVFGLKMLREGWVMSPEEGQEEYEEVQADLKKREDELQTQGGSPDDPEIGVIRTPGRRFFTGFLSTVFLQALTLTFLAEWGDRSQLATIILAAREEVFGVIVGGCLGHALCTGLAVLGGRFIAQRISVRTVTLIGGVVFIMFALSAFWIGPES